MMRTPLLVGAVVAVAGCAEPQLDTLFAQADVSVVTPDEVGVAAVELIDEADRTIRVALPYGDDTRISDALLAAHDAGIDVEVTTDYDQREDPAIAPLIDAGIPVSLTNDGLAYFEFNTNRDVAWPSEETILSTSFIVVDELHFLAVNELGSLIEGARVLVEGQGQDLADDLLKEHNQLQGNGFDASDSTSTTAFDNTAKSVADPRWLYPIASGTQMELWFGPQERITKRIIDAIYNARSDVRVLTDDLANEGLTKAMQDKAELGFDVEIIVGPRFESSSPPLSRVLRRDTPDVIKRRTTSGRNPTVVLVDYDVARDDNTYPAKAYFLSHDLYSAERLFRGDEVVTDQLIDGVLWVFEDPFHGGPAEPDSLNPELRELEILYLQHREASVEGL
jgi:hypothetical protein